MTIPGSRPEAVALQRPRPSRRLRSGAGSVLERVPRGGNAAPAAWVRDLLLRAFAACLSLVASAGNGPRVLPFGQALRDGRLGPLRTLNSYFPFHPPASSAAWKTQAAQIRRRVLVAVGLWPPPPKTPLHAVVHGRQVYGDYSVEKVYFQSMPGHFVCGSLYRPVGAKKPERGWPVVLSPHGHWPHGRFYDAAKRPGRANVRWQIADGAERFLEGGRSHLQSRCVQLARMGCIVFLVDMEGYADSIQLPHRPGMRRSMNTPVDWGFFSPMAELWLENMMGLQTWNSIRALDFLLSLPGVDRNRVAVTGASGGGTQTFILGAVDDRPTLLFPAVMVSTAMQGGCTCENAPYLRIGNGNVAMAALAAAPAAMHGGKPRPLGMTAANDWTREMPKKGFPELQKLYALLKAKNRVALFPFLYFPHNYNAVSRTRMYDFINHWFQLGFKAPILERDYRFLAAEDLTVWTAATRPHGNRVGAPHERALLRWWTGQLRRELARVRPHDPQSFAAYRRLVGGGWQVILGRRFTRKGIRLEPFPPETRGRDIVVDKYVVWNTLRHEETPAIVLEPPEWWNGSFVLWLTDAGKDGLFQADGSPRPAIVELLEAGFAVGGIDLYLQGEFLKDAKAPAHQRMVPGSVSEYTYGYNPPLFCKRVYDVLATLAAAGRVPAPPERVMLVGEGRIAGPAAAAAAFAGKSAVDLCAIDARGFRFAGVDRVDAPMFVPGALRYGDVPGLIALCAPRRMLVLAAPGADLSPAPEAWAALHARSTLTIRRLPPGGAPGARAQEIARWLIAAEAEL